MSEAIIATVAATYLAVSCYLAHRAAKHLTDLYRLDHEDFQKWPWAWWDLITVGILLAAVLVGVWR